MMSRAFTMELINRLGVQNPSIQREGPSFIRSTVIAVEPVEDYLER